MNKAWRKIVEEHGPSNDEERAIMRAIATPTPDIDPEEVRRALEFFDKSEWDPEDEQREMQGNVDACCAAAREWLRLRERNEQLQREAFAANCTASERLVERMDADAQVNDLLAENDTLRGQQAMFRRLAEKGGCILSSADCSTIEITDARARGDWWVDDTGLGFVLRLPRWLARHSMDARGANSQTCEARERAYLRLREQPAPDEELPRRGGGTIGVGTLAYFQANNENQLQQAMLRRVIALEKALGRERARALLEFEVVRAEIARLRAEIERLIQEHGGKGES